jgi:hypothetical protein
MHDGHTILVMPVSGGWSVYCSFTDNVLMFTSGARAELAARTLGACLAGLCHDTRVAIHDRFGMLIGTAHYFPASKRESRPASFSVAFA